LHFAVRDAVNDNKDAALWVLKARRLNYYTSVSSRKSEVLFESELDVLARSSLIRVRNRQEWLDVLNRLLRTKTIDKEEYRIDRVVRAIKNVKLLGEQVNDFLASPIDLRDLQVVVRDRVAQKDLTRHWATPEMLDIRLRSPVAVYPNRAKSTDSRSVWLFHPTWRQVYPKSRHLRERQALSDANRIAYHLARNSALS
jgi:hypothetical protein